MRIPVRCFCALTLFLFCFSFFPAAQRAHGFTVNESVSRSVLSNPEVQEKWYAFTASKEEQEAARGGFRPRLDLNAGVGWENLDGKGYDGRDQYDYTRNSVSLTLSQMIYDGNLTASQVKKLSHSKKMRYFDLLGTMEMVALNAVKSHEDVVRYREMTLLAAENLRRHEMLLKKIDDRTKAGVDSSVNLETTRGRLALAKVNLVTEESNLHDACTQYIRVVGEAPCAELEKSAVDIPLPGTPENAVDEALANSPRLSSTMENALLYRSAADEQRARMSPRLDLRAGLNFENDVDGTEGRRDKAMVELLLRFNVFDGGSDRATIRRYQELSKQTDETVKKTEREVRQSVLIAYNDILAIEAQLPSLAQHQKSAEIMRQAYAQQFEVGRRSLLDVLDAENEAYQAERAYKNALVNLVITKARFLAERGELLSYFNVKREDVPALQKADATRASFASGEVGK